MTYPRIQCPVCSREIALAPVDAIGMGAIVDHKQKPKVLVLCGASMMRVPLPGQRAHQEHVPGVPAGTVAEAFGEPLF